MAKNGKAIAILGGLGGLGLWLATRKPAEAAPPEPGGQSDVSMTVTLIDQNGNPIPHGSPYQLPEGGSLHVQVDVINRSRETSSTGVVRLIAISPLILKVYCTLTGDSAPLLSGLGPGSPGYFSRVMAATSETVAFSTLPFSVPWDTQGRTGQLDIIAQFPDGSEKRASNPVIVVGATISYDVDILFA